MFIAGTIYFPDLPAQAWTIRFCKSMLTTWEAKAVGFKAWSELHLIDVNNNM